MFESSLSLMGTLVLLMKRDSLEDLIVSSASFLKPLALWQRSFVKNLPRVYFAFWSALLITNIIAFLAAEMNVQLGQWQWNGFWTEVWPLHSMIKPKEYQADCSSKDVINGIDSYELDQLENSFSVNQSISKNLRSLNNSLVLRNSSHHLWSTSSLSTFSYVFCCARLKSARVGNTWIYLVYLDQLLRTYIAYNLLLIKTFYFSLLLVMLFKCSQLCSEVLTNNPPAKLRLNRSNILKSANKCNKRNANNRPCPPRPRQLMPTTTLTSTFATQQSSKSTLQLTVQPEKEGQSRCHFCYRVFAQSLCPHSLRRSLIACSRFVCHHRPGGTRVGVTSESLSKSKTKNTGNNVIVTSNKIVPLSELNHQESERLSSLIQVLLDNIREFDRVAIALMGTWAIVSTITVVALWKYVECFWQTKSMIVKEDWPNLWAQVGWVVLLAQLSGNTVELVCFVVGILWLHIYRRRLLLH